MRRLIAILLPAVLATGPLLAHAEVEVTSVPIERYGVWIAADISVPEGGISYEVNAVGRNFSARAFWGAWHIVQGTTDWVIGSMDDPGFFSVEAARQEPDTGVDVSFRYNPAAGGLIGYGTTLPEGDVTLVVMIAHDEDSGGGTLELSVPAGVEVSARSGGSVFLATERDFRGDVTVAGIPGWTRIVDVHDASLEVSPIHSFFGLFAGFIPEQATGSMAIATEEPEDGWGDALEGPGALVREYLGSAGGEYRFRISHAEGSGTFGPLVFAAGADVELPGTH